jgi:seryl-tRNA synthetase
VDPADLLVPTSEPGVYGWGFVFEDVRLRVGALVAQAGREEDAELLRFPPLVRREHLEAAGYLASFPHLAATIHGIDGATELALAPAACYPVYPAVAARGPLPAGGILVDTGDAYAFRREPSEDPARLQMFHLRELVRLGEAEDVTTWRGRWEKRAVELLCGLGLDVEVAVANDPFFGRAGRLLAANQREQRLKLELRAPTGGPEPIAVASLNYHQDHFGATFGIRTAAGPAHTACLGFGEERVTLALLHAHGADVERWPEDVRRLLWA